MKNESKKKDLFTGNVNILLDSLCIQEIIHPSKLHGKVNVKTCQKRSIVKRRNLYQGIRYSYRDEMTFLT